MRTATDPKSTIYDYMIHITKNINNNKIISKKDKEKFEVCWIFIPESFLFSHLSFENDFSKEPDSTFIEIESEFYIEKARKIENSRAVKWSRYNK